MMNFRCLALVLWALLWWALVLPALADDAPAPPTGNECMNTDYDCQPTSLSEEDYDNMAMSVEMGRDLPALVELEPLDAEDALIQRFTVNARGIMAREVPI